MVTYIPEYGDIIWLDFDPQKGREMQKRRPALILSPTSYNQKTHLALCVPITSKIKGYPFEVIIDNEKIKGAILSDQLRSLDWYSRNASFITTLSMQQIQDVLAKIRCLLEYTQET